MTKPEDLTTLTWDAYAQALENDRKAAAVSVMEDDEVEAAYAREREGFIAQEELKTRERVGNLAYDARDIPSDHLAYGATPAMLKQMGSLPEEKSREVRKDGLYRLQDGEWTLLAAADDRLAVVVHLEPEIVQRLVSKGVLDAIKAI